MTGSGCNKTDDRPAQITVGVLGHVDHGKTSLVRALTGMETDRLKEEKERGLSIVPGYAFLESEAGVIDFIDVPGHEDFIRMMVSAATGIDYLLLTVAANEGIKPQTEEHFNIAGFLDLDQGLVAITKADLVTAADCGRVRDEIRRFTTGTFMEDAPIIVTSTSDWHSINNLRLRLEQQLHNPTERKAGGQCYLPLDRVFTMSGFGTVATGTLRYGTLINGQQVEIMPRRERARIRQIQVHNKVEEVAYPGQRVAVNLRNVDRNRLARGDVLASPGYLRPTRLLDVELRLLKRTNPPPRYGETIRVLFGTCEIAAQLRILGGRRAAHGAAFLAQLVCRSDAAVPVGERLIIRSRSPVTTLGGGRILDNYPPRHRRADQRAFSRLSGLARGSTADVVYELIQASGNRGLDIAELASSVNLATDELMQLLDKTKVVFIGTKRLLSKARFNALCAQALAAIEQFHEANPKRKGQSLTALRAGLVDTDVDDMLFKLLVGQLSDQGLVQTDKTIIHLRGFDPLGNLDAEEKKIAEEISRSFAAGGLKPPALEAVLQDKPQRKRLYQLLTDSGELVPVHNRDLNRLLVFHRSSINEMLRKLEHSYPASAAFTVADIRKLVDTSRKFAIPLLEYLDSLRVTIRIGAKRKLNPGNRLID